VSSVNIGFLASGTGSNLQALLDACASGYIAAKPVVIIGNNSKSLAMQRALNAGVPVVHLSSATHADPSALDLAMRDTLLAHDVELVVLAGYNKKLGPITIDTFRNRIVNIHPGLLPDYGGEGMYGAAVHRAVLDAGESESGATVHLVDEAYDHGQVIGEARVPVLPGDTVETLAARVLEQEHRVFPDTVRKLVVQILSTR